MNCPACSSELEQLKHDRLEIDRCTACRGLWFDETELKSYLANSRAGSGVEGHPAKLGDESPLLCLRCDATPLRACRRGEVEFLKCSDCAGIFLSASSVRELRAQNRDPQVPADGGSDITLLLLLDSLFYA